MSFELPENVIVVKEGDRLTFVTQVKSAEQAERFNRHVADLFPGVVVQLVATSYPVSVVHQPAPAPWSPPVVYP